MATRQQVLTQAAGATAIAELDPTPQAVHIPPHHITPAPVDEFRAEPLAPLVAHETAAREAGAGCPEGCGCPACSGVASQPRPGLAVASVKPTGETLARTAAAAGLGGGIGE